MRYAAHGESLDHEVYRTPFKVEPEFETVDTPDNYVDRHLGTDKLPDKMQVWRVQSSRTGNVVCRAYGFEDSPDAEVIAQGFNTGKEYGAVGIGRHGNVLQWGYGDPPSQMTEAGRKLFLNCICYIHKFNGRRPLVHRTSSHRLNAVRLALLIDRIEDKSFFSSTFTPQQLDQYKGNAKGLADFYRQNLELVRRDKTFVVDVELQGLGLSSNRNVDTLDRLIELLGEPAHADAAALLLSRYTSESFRSPSQWRQWFNSNKGRFYFSDVGGYKFLVVPAGYPTGHKNQTDIGKALYR